MAARILRWTSIALATAAAAATLGALRGALGPETRPAPDAPRSESGPPEGGVRTLLARHLAEREYRSSDNESGLQAPNRRHNLRTYFARDGIRVHDRTAPGEPRLLGLSLVALGRGEQRTAVAPGEVASAGERVEIRRPGVVEWYLNSPAGLEQGFTLERRPQGTGPLALVLSVAGARAELAGSRVLLNTPTGRRLAFGSLAAADAEGRALPARFESAAGEEIALVVDDADARYPLTIDPLLTSTSDALLQGNKASAFFGTSVSGAGDVNGDGYADVIVGAEGYDAGSLSEGAAFIFLGSASGIASGGAADADTQLESNQSGALLGTSVGAAGDVNGDGYDDVIVGAQEYDAGLSNEGVALIFLGSPSGIASGNPATAATQLESDQAEALFGGSVAGAGDVNGDGYADVIVGAEQWNGPLFDEGGAFVFHGSASGIADGNLTSAAAKLESDQTGALLGVRATGAGDVNGDGYSDVIVGAEAYESPTTDEGIALVFLGGASGVGNGTPATADALLQGDQLSAFFGGSVAGAGDVNGDGYSDVIVGADSYDAGTFNEGAAFLFLGSASGIASAGAASAASQFESNQGSALFGGSVAGAGDVNGDGYADLILGGSQYDAPGFNEGAAFLFLGGAGGIPDGNPTTAAALLDSNQDLATAGTSVAGAGDVNGDGYADVISGADNYDGPDLDEGAAFVYLGSASGIAGGSPASAGVSQLEADQASAALGASVASAGDVNGDGYADAIVGAPDYDAGHSGEGAAFVFLGSSTGIADATVAAADAQLEADQADAALGASVSSAGDVDADGYADVIVGAAGYDAGETDEGAAFVFLGSPSGVADGNPASAHAQLEADQAGAALGASVASAGDVNGDGHADVIVGADGYDAGETDEGAAFVFLGGPSGVADGNPAVAAAQLEADQADAALGASVASAGDVNGDGYADVIVGAAGYDAGETDEGAAFVFLGPIADGDPGTAAGQIEADQADAALGSVASAGDVNADGYGDVIVGAAGYDAGQTDEGAAFLFLGGLGGIADATPAGAAAQLESNQAGAAMGRSAAGAGDVNADGYADVIVGAAGYDAGQTDEGAAFLFLGGPSGVGDGTPASAAAQLEADQAGAALGASVATAGDVDGDGFADAIVGAAAYDAGETDEGAAFVVPGSGDGDARAVRAQQRRGDASEIPVQAEGFSYAGGFEVALSATHPEGRGRVKLEVEACPLATPFGDAGCTLQVGSSWTDVTATAGGVRLVESLSGLQLNTRHRWRARVLFAPFGATQAGITPPPEPPHGPWRRVHAHGPETVILLPEPSEWLLLASALAGLLVLGRRRLAP
jgi:hypothetical protein